MSENKFLLKKKKFFFIFFFFKGLALKNKRVTRPEKKNTNLVVRDICFDSPFGLLLLVRFLQRRVSHLNFYFRHRLLMQLHKKKWDAQRSRGHRNIKRKNLTHVI